MPKTELDESWPPYTAAEQILFWKRREERYKLRKHPKGQDELRAIAVARQQDVDYLPLEERNAALRFLATLK